MRIWDKKNKKYWKRSLNTIDLKIAKLKLKEYYKMFKNEQKESLRLVYSNLRPV